MPKIPGDVLSFFQRQHFVIISTIDKDSRPHNSCKGIVDITGEGMVYILDLYLKQTFANLKNNPNVSITAVEEGSFRGYSLKGRATIVKRQDLKESLLKKWDEKLAKRISHRVIKNIRQEKTGSLNPETFLPKPMYMVLAKIEEVVDLMPVNIKKELRKYG
ncbi:MAG: pyridoxamine 5'-phosphate oxidase family protein [Candidatus Omnitrophota bacterium]